MNLPHSSISLPPVLRLNDLQSSSDNIPIVSYPEVTRGHLPNNKHFIRKSPNPNPNDIDNINSLEPFNFSHVEDRSLPLKYELDPRLNWTRIK